MWTCPCSSSVELMHLFQETSAASRGSFLSSLGASVPHRSTKRYTDVPKTHVSVFLFIYLFFLGLLVGSTAYTYQYIPVGTNARRRVDIRYCFQKRENAQHQLWWEVGKFQSSIALLGLSSRYIGRTIHFLFNSFFCAWYLSTSGEKRKYQVSNKNKSKGTKKKILKCQTIQ